jgi:hypothetical protein
VRSDGQQGKRKRGTGNHYHLQECRARYRTESVVARAVALRALWSRLDSRHPDQRVGAVAARYSTVHHGQMSRLSTLTLVQVLGLLVLWPVALFPWLLAATPAPLRHDVLSMHVSVFWDVAFPSWLLLFGPPAPVLGLWLVSRRRASRERPGRS